MTYRNQPPRARQVAREASGGNKKWLAWPYIAVLRSAKVCKILSNLVNYYWVEAEIFISILHMIFLSGKLQQVWILIAGWWSEESLLPFWVYRTTTFRGGNVMSRYKTKFQWWRLKVSNTEIKGVGTRVLILILYISVEQLSKSLTSSAPPPSHLG